MESEPRAQRTDEGLELLLKPRGFGRFVSAAFLLFWLCGWAIGEAFALWILIAGAIALLTGTPPGPDRAPLALGPALATGAFLIFWLSIWTLGGVAAVLELLRLVWSQDRLVAESSILRIVHRLGPFRSTAKISRDTIRRIYLSPGGKALSADTDAGPIVLSTLGSPAERDRAAAILRDELRVPEEHAVAASLTIPKGWQEIVTPEGEAALVKDLKVRRAQARVALGVTVPVVALALVLLRLSWSDAQVIPLAVMACTAAAGLAWGTARLARSRIEWRIGTGSLTRRRRVGGRLRDLFEASRLEVTRESGDGDDSFVLEAVAVGAVESPFSWRRTGRCTIERSLGDPALPRRLGAWLSDRAKVPLDDRTTRDALRRDGELALAQLRESGTLGRRVAGWVERLAARRSDFR